MVPVANRLIEQLGADVIVATQDWHPPDHGSFASQHSGRQPFDVVDLNGLQQVLWPDHCVQHSRGAAFAPTLLADRIAQVFPKGTDRTVDSYSGFFDNGQRKSTGLDDWLRGRSITKLVMLGLATDYCVKSTALDARRLDYEVTLVVDGSRGVNLDPGDTSRAIEQMQEAGIRIATSAELIGSKTGQRG